MLVAGGRNWHAKSLFVMWGLGRHVGEERLVRVRAGADERLGLSSQYIGEIVAILVPEVPNGALVVYIVVEVVGIEVSEPAVPSLGYHCGAVIAVEVLPEE